MNEKNNMENNMEKIFDLPKSIKPLSKAIAESREILNKAEEDGLTKPYDSLEDDMMSDYRYARENLRSLIENAQGALYDLGQIAASGEMPRAYEVLSGLMKTIMEANKDLLEIQHKMRTLRQADGAKSGPQNVTNAVFIGSTSELQKLIKQQS
jgi:hypothetical protein